MTRVRFAPSPTGALHIGGVRTALYNYLFARKTGGKMLLRIEDTDSARFVPGAEEYIVEALKWCGIEIDEGVGAGGSHAPYRQSERREIYKKYTLELLEKGWAYYAFDSAEELSKIRAEKEAQGGAFAYNYTVREELKTSLNMTAEELQQRLDNGEQYVVRFKMPVAQDIVMQDMVRGRVHVDSSTLDDKVLYKSADKLPTYHLANIVDDHLMEITHVIRGEEWLPSLPLHYMLYKAFEWERPEFAHLPLILKPDGKGKLSKRDGDRLGFAVFPLEWTPEGGDTARGFREDGYLPDAFINMLALLGWSPGGDKEIMTMQEMIEDFSIDKIGKSGARFDPDKARWFNSAYIHKMENSELAEYLKPELAKHCIEAADEKIEKVCGLIKERCTLLGDMWGLASFYFVTPVEYDQKVVNKFYKGDNPMHLAKVREILSGVDDFSESVTEPLVKSYITDNSLPMGQVMNTLRLSMVGGSGGASIFAITEVLGKEETLLRIDNALEKLA
ncbi:MAG: glutamate--tRNA ligase [Rikenellaceae bacterium]